MERLIRQSRSVATATITYAELYAGLTRKYREGHVSSDRYALSCRQVDEDWSSYLLVELQQEVIQLARDLIKRHPLRGFDAIHLASALRLKTELDEELSFIAADEKLLGAASAERFRTIHATTASIR